MNFCFAGTSEFAVHSLAKLEQLTTQNNSHQLVGVFCQPDRAQGRGQKKLACPVKEFAQRQQLNFFQPEKIASQVKLIKSLDIDLMIVVAYGQILPLEILQTPRYGCWNLHASLLPYWRGAAPIQRAIEANQSMTGITIMQMDAGLDSGDIISQKTTPIDDKDAHLLHQELSQLGAQELVQKINQIQQLKTTKQIHHQATYAPKIDRSEAVIDWHQPAEKILAKIRAFCIWPVCETQISSTHKIKILKAQPFTTTIPSNPIGKLFTHQNKLLIRCGKGVIQIQQLKPAGKAAMNASQFINGYQHHL